MVVLLVMVVVGLGLVVHQGGGPGRAFAALGTARPIGVAVTAGLAALTYVSAAAALIGASGRRPPFGRTVAVQLAAAFTNRALPAGVGGMVTNVRFLEREGASRGEAVASVGLTSLTSLFVHVVATALAVALIAPGSGFAFLLGPFAHASPWLAVAVLMVLAVACAAVARCRVSTCPRRDALRAAWDTVRSVPGDPRRALLVLAGTVGVTFGHAFAFAAAVRACGVGLPVGRILAVFLVGSAVGNAAPTPGGLGALEVAFVAGLTGAGAPATPAVAGVLTFRLVTYWLPVLPGAFAAHAFFSSRHQDAPARRDRRPVPVAARVTAVVPVHA